MMANQMSLYDSLLFLWRVTSPDTKPIALPQHFKLYSLKPQEFMREWSIFANDNEANHHKG